MLLYNNLIASEKNILTTQTAVKQAEEEYKIAQVKYDEGVSTNLEVMDAQEKIRLWVFPFISTSFYTMNLFKMVNLLTSL